VIPIPTMNLTALPTTHQATIPEDYLDAMGHMNVMWYIHLFDNATWGFIPRFGMSSEYFQSTRSAAFALEQHVRHLDEVHSGDNVTIYSRALGRSIKRLHFMHFMVKADAEIAAATVEIVASHADRITRRTSPLPDSIAARFDNILNAHDALDWAAPLCGIMAP